KDEGQRERHVPEEPVFFMKPTSSIINPNDDIKLPHAVEDLKPEAELAVIIGKEARCISKENALDHVFGYTVANDVTAPEAFHPDEHWFKGKSYDTFLPLGPYINTSINLIDLVVKSTVNEVTIQKSSIN